MRYKYCPRCAEKVQERALVCRFCGHEFPAPTIPPPSRALLWPWIPIGLIAALVVLGLVVDPPAEKARMAARDPAPCDRAIADAQHDRLIRGAPRGNRIEVEDFAWAAAPAEGKRGLMALWLCSYLRGRDAVGFQDFVVAYGYRSGHRVAMASGDGINLE